MVPEKDPIEAGSDFVNGTRAYKCAGDAEERNSQGFCVICCSSAFDNSRENRNTYPICPINALLSPVNVSYPIPHSILESVNASDVDPNVADPSLTPLTQVLSAVPRFVTAQ